MFANPARIVLPLLLAASLSPAASAQPTIAGPFTYAPAHARYYLLFPGTWNGCESAAVSLGGHLTSIGNAAENNWISSTFAPYAAGSSWWLGLSGAAGGLNWSNGDPYAYANWAPGQPGGGLTTRWTMMSPGTGTWSTTQQVLVAIGVARVPSGPLTLSVPGDFPTIQGAINGSIDGDTILVAAGVYAEHLDFHGKRITLRAQQGPAATFIDGGLAGTVLTFSSGEQRDTVVDGFTIRNGRGSDGTAGSSYSPGFLPTEGGNGRPGGAYIFNSSPIIRNCDFRSNTGGAGGVGGPGYFSLELMLPGAMGGRGGPGAALVSGGAPQFIACRFATNSGGAGGPGGYPASFNGFPVGNHGPHGPGGAGAILVASGNPGIAACTLLSNLGGQGLNADSSAAPSSGGPGAIHAFAPITLSSCLLLTNTGGSGGTGASFAPGAGGAGAIDAADLLELVNCTLASNTPGVPGSGNIAPPPDACVRIAPTTQAAITNCILWLNSGQPIDGPAAASYSDIQLPSGVMTGLGNMNINPRFLQFPDDLRLSPGSPCIDSGLSPLILYLLDAGGASRIADDPASPNLTSATVPIDMGAFEFAPTPTCPIDFNHNGVADVPDIFAFLSRWFAGCP